MIFHVLDSDSWSCLRGAHTVAEPGAEGFVHCCDEGQLTGVVARFFEAGTEVVALAFDPTGLAVETRYEPGADRPAERFAHVYGPLPAGAVLEVRRIRAGDAP